MSFSKLLKPLPPADPNSEFQLVKRQTTDRYCEELQAASDKRDPTAALLVIQKLLSYVFDLAMRPEPLKHFNVSLERYSKAVWDQQADAKKYRQEILGLIAAVPDADAQTARFRPWMEPGTFEVEVVGVYGHVGRTGDLLMNNVIKDSKGEFWGVPYNIEYEGSPVPVTLYVTEKQHPKIGKFVQFNMVRL